MLRFTLDILEIVTNQKGCCCRAKSRFNLVPAPLHEHRLGWRCCALRLLLPRGDHATVLFSCFGWVWCVCVVLATCVGATLDLCLHRQASSIATCSQEKEGLCSTSLPHDCSTRLCCFEVLLRSLCHERACGSPSAFTLTLRVCCHVVVVAAGWQAPHRPNRIPHLWYAPAIRLSQSILDVPLLHDAAVRSAPPSASRARLVLLVFVCLLLCVQAP